jgi:hypothetical protein
MTSAGVRQPSAWRGRLLRVVAMASRSLMLCRDRSVPFGKYWKQAVGVFVGATLPRAVRVTEVDFESGVDAEARVLRHFGALVPRQRTTQMLGQRMG